MNIDKKAFWLILLAALMLAGCQSAQVMNRTHQLADQASVPSNDEQARKLLSKDPTIIPVYIFVPKLLRATDYAASMNGRTANLRVNLNGKTIAIVPVQKGIRLNLLPNQTYIMTYGEDLNPQSIFMLQSIAIRTLKPGSFKAYDIYTDMEHANTAQVKRLTVNETLDRLNNFGMVQTKVPMPQIALAAFNFNPWLDSCLKQNDLTTCQRLVRFLPQDFNQQMGDSCLKQNKLASCQHLVERLPFGKDFNQHMVDICLKQSELAPCQQLVDYLPRGYVPNSILKHIDAIKAELQRKQKLIAMEEALPANIRRDKYMVQLSSFLKQQKYQDALAIFPKLEDLPIATDPSLKYFYGESLLKTGQTAKALQELYQYINEQGTGATHYAQALEMINQAESKL